MTILMTVLAVLFAIVGGVITISEPDTLSFDDYMDRMGELALAVAALGFGRAVKAGVAGQTPAVADQPPARTSLNDRPLMTITLGVLVLIVGVVGGVVTIADPATLDFSSYLDKMNEFAFAVAALGAGRALRKGLGQRSSGAIQTEDLVAHPDHPAVPVDLGPAVPEGVVEEDLSFIDPADEAALDEELGGEQEPVRTLPPDADVPLEFDIVEDAEVEDDLLEGELPSDDEESASPAPLLEDEALLDEPDEPTVRMPSQDQPSGADTQGDER